MKYVANQGITQYQSGIYCIESDCGKKYIGSAVKLKMRYGVHVNQIKKGKHDNPKIQNFVNKYGVEQLTFSTIELCAKEKLIEREQFYIDTLNPYFNILRVAGSTAGQRPWLGRKHSEETKAKISATNIATKGKNLKPKRVKLTYEENVNRLIQIVKSPELREKNRQKMLGHKYWLGRKHKPETIANRMGELNPNSKKIKCLELGMDFKTGREAASYLKISPSAISNSIKIGRSVFGKYTFQYANN